MLLLLKIEQFGRKPGSLLLWTLWHQRIHWSPGSYMESCILISSVLFLFLFFYFTILYWFCHTSTCTRHGCTHVPHPEPPSHLPPHTIPLGHPSAPAPSFLYPASNLDWGFMGWFGGMAYMIWFFKNWNVFLRVVSITCLLTLTYWYYTYTIKLNLPGT